MAQNIHAAFCLLAGTRVIRLHLLDDRTADGFGKVGASSIIC